MERNNNYYSRDNRSDNNRNNQNNRNNNEQFENYRDRYSSRGNYYGMNDEDAEYRNVRSTGSTAYGSGPMSGPEGGYQASNRQGSGNNNNREQYRYGDPNPYMDNDRNGGYDRTRGTGWRDNNDTGNRRGNYSGYGFGGSQQDQGRDGGYSRQDNSYQYGGSGRRYGDFGRDEGRTYNRSENSGYNAGTEDSYYDRSDFRYDSEDNNFRGGDRRTNRGYDRDVDRYLDKDDFRYSGRIQNSGSDRDDNYATGLYASNRAYNSDHQSNSDGDRVSSRENRHGRSGPDYRASSSITNYSENGGQVRG